MKKQTVQGTTGNWESNTGSNHFSISCLYLIFISLLCKHFLLCAHGLIKCVVTVRRLEKETKLITFKQLISWFFWFWGTKYSTLTLQREIETGKLIQFFQWLMEVNRCDTFSADRLYLFWCKNICCDFFFITLILLQDPIKVST